MRRTLACAFGALAAVALSAAPAFADRKNVLPDGARSATLHRGVEVVIPQGEIGSNINVSYLAVAAGGGVLPVLIDAKIDSDREKHAQNEITPLRMALVDFDAEQLAIDTTTAALGSLPWFQPGAPGFARDPTDAAMGAELAAASGDQVAFFQYVYDTSPDFSAIRVGVTITIASKNAGSDPKWSNRNVLYQQTLTSVVRLPNPTSGADNAARWAANDGALAKRALGAAFGEVGTLIPRAFALTNDDVKRLSQGERKSIDGYAGQVVEDGAAATLLFNGGFIDVATLQG